MADVPDGHAAVQGDLNRLKKWADRNLMKLLKGKSTVLPPGRNNAGTLGTERLGSNSAEKNLGVLPGEHQADHEPTMHSKKGQQYDGVC